MQVRKNSPSEHHDIALVLVDVINDLDFEGNEELISHLPSLTKCLEKLKSSAKSKTIPVIYVNDNFGNWHSDFKQILRHCCREDSPGREMAEVMAPKEDDYFILKPMHSGFYCTPLELLLNDLGVNKITLAGVAGNICVMFTANDAYMRGYSLIIPSDAVLSNTESDTVWAIEQMKKLHSAEIGTVDELIARLPHEM